MQFEVGDMVQLRVEPTRLGPVVEVLPKIENVPRYRVFHSAANIATYSHDQLCAVPKPTGSDAATNDYGDLLRPDALRARLTAMLLRHPHSDRIYSLAAARIEFIPFQFRPLTRLLRAERPRLLIADEVGVGKTIEAGLILKELTSRSPMDTALIVCPKSLTTKWRQEMRRFDEGFRILDAASLRYCLQEVHAEGAWPVEYSRVIVHYELLRSESYLMGDKRGRWPGLMTLDPPPIFNLVIADEAHHLRTAGTNSHLMAQHLSDASEALILLSATPIQLGSRDLFTLLNLLRPEIFNNFSLFDQMLEPNKHLTRAAHHLRRLSHNEDWAADALDAIRLASGTQWGTRTLATDPRTSRLATILQSDSNPSDETRLQCLRDVEDLNSLSHVMNRTRRRDIGRFTIREPVTVRAEFTSEQREFYDRLLQSRRDILSQRNSPGVVALILDGLERQASSCLPALARSVDALIERGMLSTTSYTDAPEFRNDEVELLPESAQHQLRNIADAARALPETDPKLATLLDVVRGAQEDGGPGKVLIFSFFLGTLDYLHEKLVQTGVRVGIVTGRVPDFERESLRHRFSLHATHRDALDVLLSSEVGCEGLDYQFCDRLVNYDIPWNPMRIEQRIGRIDRYGQQSAKVRIYNFITPNTVEDRIYFRCWERLDLFKNSIGDMEGVLGAAVDGLDKIANDPNLSQDQAAERAQQLADNVLRHANESRILEDAAPDLLGFEEISRTDAKTLTEDNQLIGPHDIEHLVRNFLNTSDVRGTIEPHQTDSDLRVIRVESKAHRLKLGQIFESNRQQGRTPKPLTDWTNGVSSDYPCTFSQRAAADDRQLDFVTPLHPLVRAAITQPHGSTFDKPAISNLVLYDEKLPAGQYVFAVDTWETIAVRREMQTRSWVVDLFADADCQLVQQSLFKLIGKAKHAGPKLPPNETLSAALQRLDSGIENERRTYSQRLIEQNAILIERRLASLAADVETRSALLESQLEDTKEPRISRMRSSQLVRLKKNFNVSQADLNSRRDVDVISTRLCFGVLEVLNG